MICNGPAGPPMSRTKKQSLMVSSFSLSVDCHFIRRYPSLHTPRRQPPARCSSTRCYDATSSRTQMLCGKPSLIQSYSEVHLLHEYGQSGVTMCDVPSMKEWENWSGNVRYLRELLDPAIRPSPSVPVHLRDCAHSVCEFSRCSNSFPQQTASIPNIVAVLRPDQGLDG